MHKEGYKRLVEDAFESESGSSSKPSVPSNVASDSARSVKEKYTGIPIPPPPPPTELSGYETSVNEYLEVVEDCTCKTMERCSFHTVEDLDKVKDLNTVEEEGYKTAEEHESDILEQGCKTMKDFGEGHYWLATKDESSLEGRAMVLDAKGRIWIPTKDESPSKGKQMTLYCEDRFRNSRRQESPSKGKQKMYKRPHCCSSESMKDVDQGSQSNASTHRSKTSPEKPKEQPKHKASNPEKKGGRKRHTIRVGQGMGLESPNDTGLE